MSREGRITLSSPFRWFWRHLPVLLALVPFANWLSFLLFAGRRRSKKWLILGGLYLAAWVLSMVLVSIGNRTGPDQYEHPTAIAIGSLGMLALWILGAIHVYRNRDGHPDRSHTGTVWTWAGVSASKAELPPSAIAPALTGASFPPPTSKPPPNAMQLPGVTPPAASGAPAASEEALAVADLRTLDSRRVGARLIDALLIFGGTVLLACIARGMSWGLLLFTLWASVTYFFLCEVTTGQTVGKSAMRLRVVRRDGKPPSASAIARRNVIRVFEEPVIALITLVCSRGRRQRLGDLAGGTTVGRAAQSRPPRPSLLRLAYPGLWAVCGIAFALFIGPPNGQSPASAFLDRRSEAAVAYVQRIEDLCRGHDRLIAEHNRVAPGVILRTEKRYTHQLGQVDAPPSMARLRALILERRANIDRTALWEFRLLSNSDHPLRTYRRVVAPRVREIVYWAFAPFRAAGINCAGGADSS